MKTISIFLALINSLAAGLLIALSLSGPEIRQAAAWWTTLKTLAAFSVIAIGILTWLANIRIVRPSLISLGSLFLVALGTATIVWTLHLALVTGDAEYYMLVYGGSLIVQAASTLFGALQDPYQSANLV
ncbi:MAG TPA: hypothetical protein VJ821_02465 [Anaerolineales bacterium]|nr:hypothetical protein [Anaerolineales bacterium]